jgi:predicted alpha/beta hydrolase
MTRRFPAPWRIVEISNGFAVDDATGQQLCVFYGRADPNIAGHTGFLTMDEARQMAVNFARLPELLKRTSGSQRGHGRYASVRTTVANTGRKDDPKATRASISTR